MKIENIILLITIICFYHLSFGQKANKIITITGFVLDAKQKPVENAAIFIDRVKNNSVTNHKGYYKVKVNPKAQEILVFSLFNGFSNAVINGRASINFILMGESTESNQKDIPNDSETVNTGYGTVKEKDTTTKIGKIDGQNQRFAAYQDIYDMLRGAVSGVDVTGKSIKIRGSSSLNISTEPLFVVDGVIVSSIDNLSPLIVKSIEVLKGPAASVYGTRGANGVIIITLLSGMEEMIK